MKIQNYAFKAQEIIPCIYTFHSQKILLRIPIHSKGKEKGTLSINNLLQMLNSDNPEEFLDGNENEISVSFYHKTFR